VVSQVDHPLLGADSAAALLHRTAVSAASSWHKARPSAEWAAAIPSADSIIRIFRDLSEKARCPHRASILYHFTTEPETKAVLGSYDTVPAMAAVIVDLAPSFWRRTKP
jgi:hypothetical protein